VPRTIHSFSRIIALFCKDLAKSITIPAPFKNATLYVVWFTVSGLDRACQFFCCLGGQCQVVISWFTQVSIRKNVSASPHGLENRNSPFL
jgi:hypothetical protein